MGSANGSSPITYQYYLYTLIVRSSQVYFLYFGITLHLEKYMSPATNIPPRLSIPTSPPASPRPRCRSARRCRRSLNRRLTLHLPRREGPLAVYPAPAPTPSLAPSFRSAPPAPTLLLLLLPLYLLHNSPLNKVSRSGACAQSIGRFGTLPSIYNILHVIHKNSWDYYYQYLT